MNTINVEEHIPAFSMWKMLNETVPVLRKGDCSEASIKKLAAIMQSKEGSNIFISHKDPSLSFQQYQEISNCYKAFTTWTLGQLFYLLSLEKLDKLHGIIIDAQLCILDQLSRTQLHIYQDLSDEYCKAFLDLVQYHEFPTESSLVLETFSVQPCKNFGEKLNLQQVYVEILSQSQCAIILERLTKFIKFILKENFIFYSFGDKTYAVLDRLLLLLSKSEESLRINVMEIFIDILKISRNKFYQGKLDIMHRFLTFSSLFEQYTYKIYDSQIVLKTNDLMHFESLLILFLELEQEWGKCFKNILRIQHYLFQKQFVDNDKIKPSYEVLLITNMNVRNVNTIEDSLKITRAANLNQLTLIYYFKTTIFNELSNYKLNITDIKVYSPEVSSVYSKIYDYLMKNFDEMVCVNFCCVDQFLKYFKNITNMLIGLKIQLIHTKKVYTQLYFFDEKQLMHQFLKKFLDHTYNCKTNLPMGQIFDFFTAYILTTNSKNIECIYDFFIQQLVRTLDLNKTKENPDFIGDDWELKKLLKEFQKYISSQNVSKNILIKFSKNLFVLISSGLINLGNSQVRNIGRIYMNMCKIILQTEDQEFIFLVSTDSVKHIIFSNFVQYQNGKLVINLISDV